MEKITLNKTRSIKACIVDAWHLFALDWRNYLKQLFCPALIVGMAGAFLLEMCIRFSCLYLLPAYRLYQIGSDSSLIGMVTTPSVADSVVLLLSFLVFFLFVSCYRGKLFESVLFYEANKEFPHKFTVVLNKQARKLTFRNVYISVFFFVVFVLLAAAIVWSALLWKKELCLLLPILLIYVWTTLNVVRLKYALSETHFVSSLAFGFKKSLGYSFIVQILTIVPMLLVYIVFLFPSIIYILSSFAAGDSYLIGDSVVIPHYLPVVFFVLNTFGFAILLVLNSVRTWSLVMKLNLFGLQEKVVELEAESKPTTEDVKPI